MQAAPHLLLPARYFLLLDDTLRAAGSSLDALAQDCGVSPERFREADSGLTPRQVDRLIAQALKLSGRTDIGFEWGSRLRLNSHDLLGYAMLSCGTLDQLLRLCARYYGLINPLFRMEYRRSSNRAEIIYRPAAPMHRETLHLLQEVLAASTHIQCTSLLRSPASAYDIHLSMEAPPHAVRYRTLGAARLHYGASALPEVRMVAEDWSLDAQLPMADAYAVQMAETRCKARLQRYRDNGNWTEWVRMMLNEAEDSQPALEELAGLIGTSGRTLDRYLRKEGQGFRSLALQARNERARRMLLDSDLPVSQIAYRLGYSEAANFTRAFRRDNALSPSEFRLHGQRGEES